MVRRFLKLVIIICFVCTMFCMTVQAGQVEGEKLESNKKGSYGNFSFLKYKVSEDEEFPYEIKNESKYFESSWGFGSGRYGIIEKENKYINIPCYVRINGYSYLDENGYVISSNFIEKENNIEIPKPPEKATNLWVHFSGPVYRNGWVDSSNVKPIDFQNASDQNAQLEDSQNIDTQNRDDGEKDDILKQSVAGETKKTEEVVKQIEEILQNYKTTIVVDVSGSIPDNQEQVIKQLESIEIKDETKFVVFSDRYAIVTYEQLKNKNYDLGFLYKYNLTRGTRLYYALNYIVKFSESTIILISDLQCAEESDILKTNSRIENLIIYNPNTYEDNYAIKTMKNIKEKWDANIVTYTIE